MLLTKPASYSPTGVFDSTSPSEFILWQMPSGSNPFASCGMRQSITPIWAHKYPWCFREAHSSTSTKQERGSRWGLLELHYHKRGQYNTVTRGDMVWRFNPAIFIAMRWYSLARFTDSISIASVAMIERWIRSWRFFPPQRRNCTLQYVRYAPDYDALLKLRTFGTR